MPQNSVAGLTHNKDNKLDIQLAWINPGLEHVFCVVLLQLLAMASRRKVGIPYLDNQGRMLDHLFRLRCHAPPFTLPLPLIIENRKAFAFRKRYLRVIINENGLRWNSSKLCIMEYLDTFFIKARSHTLSSQ